MARRRKRNLLLDAVTKGVILHCYQDRATRDERYDICSVKGSMEQNDDYGLYLPNVGACLADGVGGAPFGGAVARYGCQIALSSMRNGLGAFEAVARAGELGNRMIEEMDSPGSGAAITAIGLRGGCLDVAWLGDVACFHLDGGSRKLTSLGCPERVRGKIKRAIGIGKGNPGSMTCHIKPHDRIILCTDGVWDELAEETIEQVASMASSPGELCARLVLGREARDNATALALFI